MTGKCNGHYSKSGERTLCLLHQIFVFCPFLCIQPVLARNFLFFHLFFLFLLLLSIYSDNGLVFHFVPVNPTMQLLCTLIIILEMFEWSSKCAPWRCTKISVKLVQRTNVDWPLLLRFPAIHLFTHRQPGYCKVCADVGAGVSHYSNRQRWC